MILEDFLTAESVTPLSEVPLQFLVEVRWNAEGSGETVECRTNVTFSSSTLGDQQCLAIPPGDIFTTDIVVTESETRSA